MAYVYGAPRDPTAVVGRRFAAYVIDGLLVLIGFFAVLSRMHYQHRTGAPGDACAILRAQSSLIAGAAKHPVCIHIASHAWLWKRGDFLIAVSVAALIGILNLVVLQAVTGASVGKYALGLQVVDEQGRPAGFGRTIVRSLLLVIDAGIFVVGLVAVLTTRFHRRIGDFAAGTYVVANSSAGSTIGVTPAAVPYAGPVFAAPGPGPCPVVDVVPAAAPFAPAPAAPVAGWGVPQAPAPPAAPSSAWTIPPSATRPAPPPAQPPTAPAASPPPAARVEPPPAPLPPVVPAPAPPPPVVPAPAPPPPVVPAGARSTVSATKPGPMPERVPDPERWWDTAIPADPPDGEEQP